MELKLTTKIEELTPKLIAFNNVEIINELKPIMADYKNRKYAINQIADAKTDRATLNKFAKAIDDERLRIKKIYNKPYVDFEKQVNEITTLIEDASNSIDVQIKDFKNSQDEEKIEQIKSIWENKAGDILKLIDFSEIMSHNKKWLNTTNSLKDIDKEIEGLIKKINSDLEVIKSLDFLQEEWLVAHYIKEFDISETMHFKTMIEEFKKRYQSFEKQKVSQTETFEVDFRVYATERQKKMLRQFMIENGIKYGAIAKEGE